MTDELTFDVVKSQPLLKGASALPPVISSLGRELFPLVTLPSACAAVIEAFSHPDVTADRVAQVVSRNPALEEQFLRCVQSVSKRPERASLEGAVVLLGMQNSRNLLVALQVHRLVQGKPPQFSDSGKVDVEPKNILKSAMKFEESLGAKDKSGALETAFSAGLIFDVLRQIALLRGFEKTIVPMIDQGYSHGLRTAIVARALADVVGDFPLKKIAFSAALIHDVGKLMLLIQHPEYVEFTENCGKIELPRDLRSYAEMKRFGTTHAEVGARLVGRWPTLAPAALAVLFHHRAQMLKPVSKKDFQLAAVVHLATKIATKYKQPDGPEDPMIAAWMEPELRGFLPAAKIVAALQNVNF